MHRTLRNYLMSSTVLRDAPGEASAAAGGGDAAAVDATSPESILFPTEGSDASASASAGDDDAAVNADATKADADATKAGDDASKAGEWKEYENDPAKSEADNAAAKAAHDAANPALPANQVPEDGKYTLTMPDGVEVDQKLVDALGPDFKDLGLTNAQAQKLADKFIEVKTTEAKDAGEKWAKTITKWGDDAKADKEIGGAAWNDTVKSAHRAVNEFGTPALKNYLDATGGGNHPELIRFMSKVGNLISEDAPPAGGAGGSGAPANPAHVLFPNDIPKG